jgi:hypothetical protein
MKRSFGARAASSLRHRPEITSTSASPIPASSSSHEVTPKAPIGSLRNAKRCCS